MVPKQAVDEVKSEVVLVHMHHVMKTYGGVKISRILSLCSW